MVSPLAHNFGMAVEELCSIVDPATNSKKTRQEQGARNSAGTLLAEYCGADTM